MRRLSSCSVRRGGEEVVEDRIAFLCRHPLGECGPSTLDTTRGMCLEPWMLLAPLLSYALGCVEQILAHTAVETQGSLCTAPCVLLGRELTRVRHWGTFCTSPTRGR